MKHVLHLASWYPNRKGPQDGDFIQRQLQALAAYTPVHVLAVIKDDSLPPGNTSIEKNEDGNLFQTIAYYNGYKTGIKKLDTLLSLLAFQKNFRNLVKAHINTHGKPELIHVHVAFRAGLIALWSARKYKIPYIVSEHWSGYKKEDKSGFYFQPHAVKSFIRKILNGARIILPVSASLAEDIKKITSNTSFEVVHNVVDESLFLPPDVANKSLFSSPGNKRSKKFRFLHVSTMGPEKQPEMLFRAFDAVSKNEEADLNKQEEADLNKNEDADLKKQEEADLNKNGEADPNKNEVADLKKQEEADLNKNGEADPNKNGEADLNKNEEADLNKNGAADLIKNGNCELVCLGTVPDGLSEWVRKNTSQAGNILFLGNVPYSEVARQMREADCLVITSLYETFSCVAAEGLLSGLPVISTPVGVIPELLTAENGLVIKNEDELISAMRQMQANQNAFRPDLIAAAQKGRFSYQTIGAKLVELYNNL